MFKSLNELVSLHAKTLQICTHCIYDDKPRVHDKIVAAIVNCNFLKTMFTPYKNNQKQHEQNLRLPVRFDVMISRHQNSCTSYVCFV